MGAEFGVFLCYTARVRVLIELSRLDGTELVVYCFFYFRLTGIMFAGYTLRVLSDLYR